MMTMTETLLKRDGTVFEGTVTLNDKGKPGYMVTDEKCHRCGGAGGYNQWPGFTCFRCRGNRFELPYFVPLYTADKLAKMNAAQTKRDAAKTAKIEAKMAEAAAVVAKNTENFNTEHAELLSQLGSLVDEKPIVADIVRKGREKGSITEPQKSVLVNMVASAKKQAETAATSAHVGVIGDKVKATVTVTHVGSFERAAFGRYGAVEIVYIVSMTDENGNVFVTKTPNFNENKGETFILSGIVKAHDEYKGVKQTVLKNAKRTEIPTGTAAGFKKIVS